MYISCALLKWTSRYTSVSPDSAGCFCKTQSLRNPVRAPSWPITERVQRARTLTVLTLTHEWDARTHAQLHYSFSFKPFLPSEEINVTFWSMFIFKDFVSRMVNGDLYIDRCILHSNEHHSFCLVVCAKMLILS